MFQRTLGNSWLREPLLHFALLGALIFAGDRWLHRADDTIVVTKTAKAEVRRVLESRLGRAPDAQELQQGLDAWKRDEALYRDAVQQGLLQDDGAVRAQMVAKQLDIARQREVLTEATKTELRAYFEAHRAEYRVAASYDLHHVFVSLAGGTGNNQPTPEQRAHALLASLRAGKDPEGLGDHFPRGPRFSEESVAEIRGVFGEQAAASVATFAVDTWNLVPGPRGFHLLKVVAVHGGEPNFETALPSLKLAYTAEQRERAADAFARSVVAKFRFTEAP